MPYLSNKIRNLSLVILKKDNRFLASAGFDQEKNENFYRLVGGGIEFGETSLEALKREIKEELGFELINYKLLAVIENTFSYNGKPGHEICFIYEADFKDKSNYEIEEFKILDSHDSCSAIWVDRNDLENKKVYPEGVINYL